MRFITLLAAGVGLAAMSSGIASAQTATQAPPADAEQASSVDDIIVTARKRSERLIDVPVAVTARFYLPRLASQPKRAAWWPVRKHDVDRLSRACLDAITASQIWCDDGQVCRLVATKEYAAPGTPARLELEIREMTE